MPISGRPTLGNSDELCARFRLERLEVARGWWGRARGLLGRSALPVGHGLLITPCSAIHTVGMRFAIDVVFLDAQGRVVNLHRAVIPNRLFIQGGRGAVAALELPAGTAADWPGDAPA